MHSSMRLNIVTQTSTYTQLTPYTKILHSCSSIKDLELCPTLYCADNPLFHCEQDGNECKCPSCDSATDRTLCVHTHCLEQPQKVTCVFDSETQNCHCPACEDQDGDRMSCLLTHCGLNNSLQCRLATCLPIKCPLHVYTSLYCLILQMESKELFLSRSLNQPSEHSTIACISCCTALYTLRVYI